MTGERMIMVPEWLVEEAASLIEQAGLVGTGVSLAAPRLRAALAQPSAGEPVAEFFVDFDTLRKALSIYGLAAPVSNEELGLQMDRQAVRVIEAVARLPFPYPPAAAHGASGEPVAWLYEYGDGGSKSPALLSFERLKRDMRPGKKETPLYAAPPAAAHGDEAVRKIRGAFPLLDEAGLDPEMHCCECNIQQERKRLHRLLDAAMRAQGDGGEV